MTKRVLRVMNCGNYLEFKRYNDNSLKLHYARFCKVRLCPMCAWRRSLKIFGQVSKVMNEIDLTNEYTYLFLTLTCRNVEGEELPITIDELFYSFKKLIARKRFKESVEGYFRALEVTYKYENDTFHPHFHIVLVVKKSYFKRKDLYISQLEWTSLWKSVLKVNYTPIVDIRKVRGRKGQDNSSAVAELAKYTVKDNDYIISDIWGTIDEERTDKNVKILDYSLANRRLSTFGGLMRDIQEKLKLDDITDGDLINTNIDDDLHDELEYVIETYRWNIGYNNYFKED